MSEPYNYGGQAVIEGVMMRGRQSMAVAVRHPSGEVVIHSEPLRSGLYRSPWAKRPFIRGVLMLWDTLALGMRALVFSANVAMEEEESPAAAGSPAGDGTVHSSPAAGDFPQSGATAATGVNGSAVPDAAGEALPAGQSAAKQQAEAAAKEAFGGSVMWGTMALSLVFGIALFFVSPLLLTRLVDHLLPTAAASVAVEGVIRICLFFGYVWLIGRLPDVRRVFAYHGAEHKTINAYEAGVTLDPAHVARFSVAHPRCGTAFLLYVVVLSIFFFGLLGRPSLPVRIATRIAFIPVVASVAYEVIRFSARRQHNPAVRALLAPGLALQKLTTREPDDSQVEVAIAALNRVLENDGVIAGPPVPQPALL